MGADASAEMVHLPSGAKVVLRWIPTKTMESGPLTQSVHLSDGFASSGLLPKQRWSIMTYPFQNMALPGISAPKDDQAAIISLADCAAPFADADISHLSELFTIQSNGFIWEPL